MRYSSDRDEAPAEPLSSTATNRAFFEKVSAGRSDSQLRGALLFVGGNDYRALAVRRAQSPLRFDRRPSLWSHVALIAHWNAQDVGKSIGLEVTLDPPDTGAQAPERNGVTTFELARYFDTARFPNVALVAIDLGKGKIGEQHKDAILDAACNPCRDRERYPLWNGLSTWARYAYAPELVTTPLLDGIAYPGAALCEYAFESAGVDLTPGATGNHACPETLWATVRHWQARMQDRVRFDASMIFRDPGASAPDALPMTIALPNTSTAAAATKRRKR